jgi:hypothetical protein
MNNKELMNQQTLGTEPDGEEFALFMSLALDGLLDKEESAAFQSYLNEYPGLAEQWRAWQWLHKQFTASPSVLPSINFLERFEQRLLHQERRRHLWFGVVIGLASLLLWGGMLAGALSFVTYVLFNRANWLSESIRALVYWTAALDHWRQTVTVTLGATLTTPQAVGMGLCYLAVAVSALALWTQFLRRTTRTADITSHII